jgi:polar amino acid transport system substrate-binding protein
MRMTPARPAPWAALALAAALAAHAPAQAQTQGQTRSPTPGAAQATAASAGPGFWDPRRRPERPDLSRLTLIRFMTEVDYPPFDYAGQDGNPTGFNVDLARALCEELHVTCTVQMRRFDTLFDALADNKGDAAIASISVTPESRARADFSDPYYRPVARFVARRDAKIDDVRPEKIEGKTIAVVAGTAHELYLRTLFTEAEVKPYKTADAAHEALHRGETDLLFGDGFALSFWLNGTDSANCCAFVGGPFLESRYFGEGVGVAVKHGNDTLRLAINWALFRLWEKGRYTDLWLRYFPINPY